jgi:O-antigen/teichoic acid export membrane protein
MTPASSLAARTARGVQWRFVASFVGAISQLAVGAILSRLLAPAEFGLIALAGVVLGFTRLVGDLGVANAVVQRRDLTERHVRAAFTVSVLLGVVLAAVGFAIAPLGAAIIREPRVTPLLRVMSVGFVIGGAAAVANAQLRRRLDFRTQFVIDTFGYLVGYAGVTVLMALRGYGVWSLVVGGLTQSALGSGAQLVCGRHPMRPLLARRELGDLLRFGVGAQASVSVNYVALNGDNFLVGRVLGASAVGLYNRAYTLMNLPYTYASNVLSTVLFPAFVQVQDDVDRLRRGYLTMTRVSASIAGPSMVTLAIGAPYLVPLLYGTKWVGAVLPLQVLCAAGYFRALYHVGGIVAQSVGQVYNELWRQTLYAGLVVLGSSIGVRYGLAGVALGVAAGIVAMYVAMAQLSLRITRASWREYVHAQKHGAIAAASTGAAALTARMVLSAAEQSDAIVAAGILTAAAVPSGIALMWLLSDPELATVHAQLPRWCRVVTRVAVRYRSEAAASA